MNYKHPGKRQRLLRRLFKKFKGICQYCYKEVFIGFSNGGVQKDYHATIDHINAYSVSKDKSETNLTLSCSKCNNLKGNKPVKKFLKCSQLNPTVKLPLRLVI